MVIATPVRKYRIASEDDVSWKPTACIPVKAAIAVRELARIEDRDKVVAAPVVVKESRPDDAPLHPCFEWDDAVAAERHRESQAGHLFRSLVVVYRRDDDDEPSPPTRYLVKPKADADDPVVGTAAAATQPGCYVRVSSILEEPELRDRYVKQAMREALSWRKRYDAVSELEAVFSAIDDLAEELGLV